jgi:FAD/FMN-containing dehydrogenase
MAGSHASQGDLVSAAPRQWAIPFESSFSLVNSLSIKLFNAAYYHRQLAKEVYKTVSYSSFFYPLDGISHWNRMYGKKGFQQYQCVLPRHHAREVAGAVIAEIARSGTGSFLAILKQFGDIASPGLLSFPLPGVTLALDFSQREQENTRLFSRLNAMVHEAGGRLYPAKDAQMSANHFQQAYPAWQQLEAQRDPQLLSQFWKRVTQ